MKEIYVELPDGVKMFVVGNIIFINKEFEYEKRK